jgi:biotin synthase-related radical SAM superfamily protein
MLRATIEDDRSAEPKVHSAEDAPLEERAVWRVSSGSAAVLGLCVMRMDAAPTTAYLMLGERCVRDCAFCTQARSSRASAAALSRVLWPEYSAEHVAQAIAAAHARGEIARACFQVTVGPQHLQRTRQAVALLASHSSVPICASVLPRSVEDVELLLSAGAERITIALDAACERVYRLIKSGSWSQAMALLESSARLYPGRLGTHLIVGLGETEREMADCMQQMVDLKVHVALFAFTPVPGTAMADRQPPPLAQYRRMQVARWLIVRRRQRAERFRYVGDEGQLVDYGLSQDDLRNLLRTGEAFQTSGCPGCNRPYYNERPGGILYNYPRPLTAAEAKKEIETLFAA